MSPVTRLITWWKSETFVQTILDINIRTSSLFTKGYYYITIQNIFFGHGCSQGARFFLLNRRESTIRKMHPTLHNFEDSDTLRTAPLYSYPVVSRIKKKDSKTTMTPSYGNQNAGKIYN